MIILGIGGILGRTATALLNHGELVAAVEEAKLARAPSGRRTQGSLLLVKIWTSGGTVSGSSSVPTRINASAVPRRE